MGVSIVHKYVVWDAIYRWKYYGEKDSWKRVEALMQFGCFTDDTSIGPPTLGFYRSVGASQLTGINIAYRLVEKSLNSLESVQNLKHIYNWKPKDSKKLDALIMDVQAKDANPRPKRNPFQPVFNNEYEYEHVYDYTSKMGNYFQTAVQKHFQNHK